MTSATKREANRANARASTGPRTGAGRARFAQNARRHGLSVPALADPHYADEVRRRAEEIAAPGADAETIESACRIAEAQVDLERVRQARQRFLANCDTHLAVNEASEHLTRTLGLLDRYERRALSRRKFAIRAFDLARRDRGKAAR